MATARMSWIFGKDGDQVLSRESAQAFARLGYDPNTAPTRPSPDDVHRAAQSLLSRLKKLPLS